MNKLSVVIITYNEESNIVDCIDSVKPIADEIIVLDSFSTDKTVQIAESLGAIVFLQKFQGHIEQKNAVKDLAKYDLILSIDADERLSKELINSIVKIKHNITADAYTLNRLNNYCGKWIKHGGWYPDKKLRIWKNGIGYWGGVNPHDKYIVPDDSIINHLNGNLLHYSFKTISQHVNQVNHFTDIMSDIMKNDPHRIYYFNLIFAPVFKFIKDYFIRRGFLDGYSGFIIAAISSFSTFLKYIKILTKKPRH
jgi:glycosyltransferase involved in cell wall biosynthesis